MCLHQTGLFHGRFVFHFIVLYWSHSNDDRYRITHQPRTKQRGKEQRYLEEVTTWDEIERWSVDPGRVSEPTWDSLEQCEEGFRRMELATRTRQRNRDERHPQKCRVWLSQVGDLSQLPVLTVERGGPGRHRVMP